MIPITGARVNYKNKSKTKKYNTIYTKSQKKMIIEGFAFKMNRETVDHLFLRCDIARELWIMGFFFQFEILIDLLAF
jgi:hypothetical protein